MYSKFNTDKLMEEYFGQWLDEHFYPKLIDVNDFKRIDDYTLQKKGVDVIVRIGNEEFFLDEKTTLHYINKNIPTFAFELMNRTSGARGWLHNPDYLTSHYVLCWPNGNLPINSKDSFTTSEVMILDRNKLLNYLDSIGLSYDVLLEKIENYSSKVTRTTFKFELVPGINLFFTEWLYEKPVNIVIQKSILASIADYYKIVK